MLGAAVQIALVCGALGLVWRLGRRALLRFAPASGARVARVGIWCGVALILLTALTSVHDSHAVVAVDSTFKTLFDGLRHSPAIHFVVWLTRLGDSAALVAVTVIVTGFLLVMQQRHAAIGLWAGFLGVESSIWLLKFWIDWPRPGLDIPVETVLSPSYPSAHAAGALLVYGLVGWLLVRRSTNPSWRYDIAFAATATIGTIAISRLMLSVHRPSEVAAGLLLGAVWLGVAAAVVKRLERPHRAGHGPT